MSGGGQIGSSSQTQSNVPDWAVPYEQQFMGVGNTMLTNSNNAQNQAMTNQGQQQLQDTVSGQYLNPDTNPYLQQTANTIRTNAQQNLDQSYAGADRNAQGSGMLLSSADAKVKDTLAQQSGQNVTNQLTNLYGQNYATERQNQVNAVAPLINQGQLSYNQAFAIAQMLQGLGGSSGSNSSQLSLSI